MIQTHPSPVYKLSQPEVALCANPPACSVPLCSNVPSLVLALPEYREGKSTLDAGKDWHYMNTGRGYLSCMLKHIHFACFEYHFLHSVSSVHDMTTL